MATLNDIGQIHIAFSAENLLVLNLCLGFIMFGIALGIHPGDFRRVILFPKSVITGVISQFVLLPALTLLIIYIVQPHPALGLGMILVAVCPGGNVSNFISATAGANVALSVSLTAFATLLCPVLTPLNFEIWAALIPNVSEYLKEFNLNFRDVLKTVFLVLIIPLAIGIWFNYKFPKRSMQIGKPVRIISFLILLGFIAVALVNNFRAFQNYLSIVFLLVLVHNVGAFAVGYFTGKLVKIPEADCRSVAIETGIQNSGLGLIIIFTFFQGNGAMALVAAWWGIWHIIAGLILARIFVARDRKASHVAT